MASLIPAHRDIRLLDYSERDQEDRGWDNDEDTFRVTELIRQNLHIHVEFTSCPSAEPLLRTEDFAARDWNDIRVIDGRPQGERVYPPGWSPEPEQASEAFANSSVVHLIPTAVRPSQTRSNKK